MEMLPDEEAVRKTNKLRKDPVDRESHLLTIVSSNKIPREVFCQKMKNVLTNNKYELVSVWNSVWRDHEVEIGLADDRQREEFDVLSRRVGKYVRLLNDVKERFWDRRDVYRRFLQMVLRYSREANSVGKIYKDAHEMLEGDADLMKQLICALKLPASLNNDDGMDAYYLSVGDLEELRHKTIAAEERLQNMSD